MTDRQARRIEKLLRFQCMQNNNTMVTLRALLMLQVGIGAETMKPELEGHKKLLVDLLDALVKDEQAERLKQVQTREQQEAMEAELHRLDEEMASRPPVGFK